MSDFSDPCHHYPLQQLTLSAFAKTINNSYLSLRLPSGALLMKKQANKPIDPLIVYQRLDSSLWAPLCGVLSKHEYKLTSSGVLPLLAGL